MGNIDEANKLYSEGSFADAFNLYKVEAEQGNVSCQSELGFMYYQGKGTSRDLDAAENWFKKAFAEGDEQAGVGLFRVYVERDEFDKALHYMRIMEEKEYPPALYWLGRMYYNGFGVQKDLAKAFEYFTQAAEHGHFVGTRDRAKLMLKGFKGFFARFLGVYELARLVIVMAVALRKDFDDERRFF